MEDLFSTDSFCHKFIRERNDTSGSAQIEIGTLREDVLTKLYCYSFLMCVVFCDVIESHLAFFISGMAKEASVSISINNGKMGTFGIGTACPSLVSRSAGRAGK